MLQSFGIIFLLGMALGYLFKKVKLPSLLGMLIAGMVLGPFGMNWIDSSILEVSAQLRQIALVIILMRAGLGLDIKALKKAGRPAALLCFLPACFEIGGMAFLAPKLFGITVLEAAIMGAVIAAVSPAVIVPRMLKMAEEGWGEEKSIPQMIMAGASVDDVFVIVLFTSFMTMAQGGSVSPVSLLSIPISILTGAAGGALLGFFFSRYFKMLHMRDSVKVVLLLSLSFLLVAWEDTISAVLPFSSLLAVMMMGAFLRKSYPVLAKRLSDKFARLWVAAEVMLFVLVGAAVDTAYALSAGPNMLLLILLVLLFRMGGVWVSMIKTGLDKKERLFCVIAYLPKATVQAAIGGVPLAVGLDCGQMVLTAAVLAILITAPVGAFGIDISYKKLLNQSVVKNE